MYMDEHKEMLLRDNPRCNKSRLANEHMRKFTGWLQDQISQSLDIQTSEYLNKLAQVPLFIVVTYQEYDINGYMFYTEQQDKKSTYQNSGVRVDSYDVTGQDKNMY
jgi:pyridoxine/pyridoxamine 5'-phosphate oxidase